MSVILVRALSEMLAKALCVQKILILAISLDSIHSYTGTKYMWNFTTINLGPIHYSAEIIKLYEYYNQRANIFFD